LIDLDSETKNVGVLDLGAQPRSRRSSVCNVSYTLAAHRTASTFCEPFHSTFPVSSVSSPANINQEPTSPFVATSPEGSYLTGNDGLVLFLQKPAGHITTKDGVNDKIAVGATVNSTFTFQYKP
jgi:hypothetical protein